MPRGDSIAPRESFLFFGNLEYLSGEVGMNKNVMNRGTLNRKIDTYLGY